MLSQRDNIIEVLNHLIQVSSFFSLKREIKILRREWKGKKEQFSRGRRRNN